MSIEIHILQIVRGEVQWNVLRTLGIDIRRDRDCWFFPSAKIDPVSPALGDVILGVVTLSSSAEKLREWASFLLAASSFINLDNLDETALGKDLREALWDISFGEPVDHELLDRAQTNLSRNKLQSDSGGR